MKGSRDAEDTARFREIVKTHYRRFGRSFPWRDTRDPYAVTVSEFMLQQTGTERVLKKYPPFLAAFPTFTDLAGASLRDVLVLWRGLGYNRRAKALLETCRRVRDEYGGVLPGDPEILLTFPGIGPGTAGSIPAFAYNRPTVFIETNIRRVFLHFFFSGREAVRDGEILPLAEAALDRENPREWYYALMDYGVYLKGLYPDPNRRSAHYAVQTRFEDSNRQVRGRILAALAMPGPDAPPALSPAELAAAAGFPEERILAAARGLVAEGIVAERDGKYAIA